MTQTAMSRDQFEAAARTGDFTRAVQHLRQLWEAEPSSANAGFIVRSFEGLRERLSLTPLRVFFLSTYTVDPLLPLLRAAAYVAGIELKVGLGGYNTVAQLALDPQSELYRFEPQLVFLVQQTRDAAPDLYQRFALLSEAARQAAERETIERLSGVLRAIRRGSNAAIVMHTLEAPADPATGILDVYAEHGQTQTLQRINAALASSARELGMTYLLDSDAVLARRGTDHVLDERRFASVKLPFASTELLTWVQQWMRFVHPVAGRSAKVLAVDLDNTLWGGVIGEDGMDGIQLSSDHRGAPYLAVQQVMLDLKQRGVLLVLCSKNNEADALEVLDKHPCMRVRAADLAGWRINWQDKAQNLRELASELNLGLDAFVFLDDNAVERAWVREQLPEVTVLELPESPFGFASVLRRCPWFERLSLTTEDRERSNMYAAERKRAALQTSTASLSDFLQSLEQEAEVASGTRATLARMAQLTQKTNQFNLTTRRYGEAELGELLQSPEHVVLSLSVRDRFGDHGLVGVAIARVFSRGSGHETEDAEVDTFLLSCRVLSRGVETAFLAALCEQLQARGATRLLASFIPTKKNAPARHFLAEHGLHLRTEAPDRTSYELDLAAAPRWPGWITRTKEALGPKG